MATDLVAISVTCSKCGATTPVDPENLNIYSTTQECELCGSHGESTIEATCGECKRYILIASHTW